MGIKAHAGGGCPPQPTQTLQPPFWLFLLLIPVLLLLRRARDL